MFVGSQRGRKMASRSPKNFDCYIQEISTDRSLIMRLREKSQPKHTFIFSCFGTVQSHSDQPRFCSSSFSKYTLSDCPSFNLPEESCTWNQTSHQTKINAPRTGEKAIQFLIKRDLRDASMTGHFPRYFSRDSSTHFLEKRREENRKDSKEGKINAKREGRPSWEIKGSKRGFSTEKWWLPSTWTKWRLKHEQSDWTYRKAQVRDSKSRGGTSVSLRLLSSLLFSSFSKGRWGKLLISTHSKSSLTCFLL